MSLRQKSGTVVVAVRACSEISRTALKWALKNVVKTGDCVKLLVVIPDHGSSNKLWFLSKLRGGDCSTGDWKSMSGTFLDQKDYVTDLCNHMMRQLRDIYDSDKVKVKMKMVYESKDGVVASEAKRAQSQWVVLDKLMKKEARFCMEQLDCSVVVMKNSEPHVLRLNLTDQIQTENNVLPRSKSHLNNNFDATKVPNVTPTTSPDHTFLAPIDSFSSPKFLSEINWDIKEKQMSPLFGGNYDFDESDYESDSSLSIEDTSFSDESLNHTRQSKESHSLYEMFQGKFSNENPIFKNNAREIVLWNKKSPDPPPLCSICRNITPSFGQPPRLFSYDELALATGGFSEANFLAEGGYGSVHRGVLLGGQVIAVKQHKSASAQGDREFCSEVRVLSCAQHRNVVMLIGYCVEERKRLLVYEYICNGSLDSHLYGDNHDPLEWDARQKIAVGSARGLRYLHEECRVGCIVHRDMRPNNILLTHDFEPLVGDFGLARLQPDGDSCAETRIIGAFGYLAPEYAQTGQVSEKADVYSFGVVLVELITGRKAVDISRPKGQQCLSEWARPLLERNALLELIDPRLRNCYSEKEVQGMMHCASLCIQRDAASRPRMSQVLRILEGNISMR